MTDATLEQGPTAAAPWLALERQVRHHGTGLVAEQLHGCWRLEQLWPRGRDRAAAASGWLLRGLAARLVIAAAAQGPALQVSNAVQLGALQLRFVGQGRLQGRRPLLLFQFEQLQIRWGTRLLLQRPLPAPAPQRQPFFALIARTASGCLVARGRGGGLALWQRAKNGEAPTAPRGEQPTARTNSQG